MSKLYNEFNIVVNDFRIFFSKFSSSKTLLNFVPQLFASLIYAESSTLSKISLAAFQTYNSDILLDSITKRISHTLHNPSYSLHSLFDSIVKDCLSRFKLSHSDKNVHISFDHMFVKS